MNFDANSGSLSRYRMMYVLSTFGDSHSRLNVVIEADIIRSLPCRLGENVVDIVFGNIGNAIWFSPTHSFRIPITREILSP